MSARLEKADGQADLLGRGGPLAPLLSEVRRAQDRFAAAIEQFLSSAPPFESAYQRYLSMQYHLTRGVQEYFIRAASHGDLLRMKSLRQFLLDFGNEEEMHYT